MDHQAVAQLLVNYEEFVGANAVVVTLVFVGVQVRQSTRTMAGSNEDSNFNRDIPAVV